MPILKQIATQPGQCVDLNSTNVTCDGVIFLRDKKVTNRYASLYSHPATVIMLLFFFWLVCLCMSLSLSPSLSLSLSLSFSLSFTHIRILSHNETLAFNPSSFSPYFLLPLKLCVSSLAREARDDKHRDRGWKFSHVHSPKGMPTNNETGARVQVSN